MQPSIHAADVNLLPGVPSDEGTGDDWTGVRRSIMRSDVVVIGTPIWRGQPSSICKRVLERIQRRRAHHVCAEVFQALVDVGFTIPASVSTYWVVKALGSVNYTNLERTPEKKAGTARTLAEMTARMAVAIKLTPYPSLRDEEVCSATISIRTARSG